MTTQEIKEYFKQIRKEQSELMHLIEMRRREELSLLPKGITYDGDRVQSTPEDTLSKTAAKIVDIQQEIDSSILGLRKRKAEAESYISKLECSNEREVMRWYYMDNDCGKLLSWQQVAEKMGYTEKHVLKLHGTALLNLSKELKKVDTK